MSNPDLSALTAYAGKYEKAIFARLFKELQLQADGIQVLNGVKSKMKLTRLNVSKGVKPYTGKFVSMDGQLKYAERTISAELAQRDIEIEPKKYQATWQAETVPGTSGASNMAIPFAQWVWDTVMKETAEEVVSMLYFGEGKAAFAAYSGATAYSVGDLISFTNTSASNETQYYKCIVATSAGESPLTDADKWEWAGNLALNKGIGKIFDDAVSNDGFDNIISTGDINALDAYDQYTSVWRGLPDEYKKRGAMMYSSQTSYEYLMDALENINKYSKETNEVLYLPKTGKKAMLKPVDWLSGSNKIIATPMNNLIVGTDSLSDLNDISTVPTVYTLQSGITFTIGVEVRDLDGLAINDAD